MPKWLVISGIILSLLWGAYEAIKKLYGPEPNPDPTVGGVIEAPIDAIGKKCYFEAS